MAVVPLRTNRSDVGVEPELRSRGRISRRCVVSRGLLAAVIALGAAGHSSAGEERAGSVPHWAFQPVERPAVPAVDRDARARTSIDAFLLDPLEAQGLTFREPASRHELIRRATYDLLGLPPTPEEIDDFVSDDRPDAFERLIDRLLASPRYGEAWGRMWLDLVRFAETAGYNADTPRPLAWKYRDYVIRSFNEDKPYSQFVAEQLAGDELYPDRLEALVATGYNRMWPDESNSSNILLARQDALNDLTGNVASVFLGLSLGCAQCHDHKFDPLLQDDFYELQAFFAGIVPQDEVPLGTRAELTEYRRQLDAWLAGTEAVRGELHQIEAGARARAGYVKRLKFPAVVLEAIDTAPELRTAFQRQLVFWSERQIELKDDDVLKKMGDDERQRREALRAQLAELEKRKPRPPRTAPVMATVEVQPQPPETFLLASGSYDVPLDEVQPAFIDVLAAEDARFARVSPPHEATSGRRTALVAWLTDPSNPLFTRVMANRVWQGHFGRGLVENANDFGTQTPPPSHPELLDWLAAELVEGHGTRDEGRSLAALNSQLSTPNSQLNTTHHSPDSSAWRLKRLHRLILSSEAYGQSTGRRSAGEPPARAAKADPDNRLLWHFPRRRLSAERIRDAILAVSGRLSEAMYGPGVHPELPPDYTKREAWKVSEDRTERNRRSVYIFAKRNLPYPLLKEFDFPDMHESCAQRPQTTIAPQALMLLNSELIIDAAEAMAERVRRASAGASPAELVTQAYRLAFGREPDSQELHEAAAFLDDHRAAAASDGDSQESVPPTALADLCHALLNANEFLYVE
ncbi:MAG TPA: DUF1549 and DUF1553 domain-containing protein [Planctomycetaceae bacterium]|nr:DUF1549 and DUF1553 domain-containing protein [Planctomycetaceae bacterium]